MRPVCWEVCWEVSPPNTKLVDLNFKLMYTCCSSQTEVSAMLNSNLLRGRSRKGKTMSNDHVLMKFPGVSKTNFAAFIAFLQSEKNTVQADITGDYPNMKETCVELVEAKREPDAVTFHVTIKVWKKYRVRDNRGGILTDIPRRILDDMFTALGIFPCATM